MLHMQKFNTYIISCLDADFVEVFRYHDSASDESLPFYHHVSNMNHAHRARRNASNFGMTSTTVTELLNISAVTTISPQLITDVPVADDIQITSTDVPELESTSAFPDNSSLNITVVEVSSFHGPASL